MAYDDLRSLLRALEREGDLKRIKAEVDPYLEVGEIVDRVNKAGGPALLFENVRGSAMPLAMNVYGTDRRLLKALGLKSYDEISDKIGGLLKPELPHGFVGRARGVRQARLDGARAAEEGEGRAGAGGRPHGDDVDLDQLPALFTWPEDGGSFFNLGLTHTKDPETRRPQPRALPAPAPRPAHHRHALADPQGQPQPLPGGRQRRASGCRSRSPSAARPP